MNRDELNKLFDEHFKDDCDEVLDARNEIVGYAEKVVKSFNLKSSKNLIHMEKEYTKEDLKGDCQYCKHIIDRGTYGGKCVNDDGFCSDGRINWEWNGNLPYYDYINFSNDDWLNNKNL